MRRAASVIGATSRGSGGLKVKIEGSAESCAYTVGLPGLDMKKGGVASRSDKVMAGSAVGGVRKRWMEVALLKTVVLKDKMPVGASGQGPNFLVMSATSRCCIHHAAADW